MGNLIDDLPETDSSLKNGTIITFTPDETMFGRFRFIPEYVETMIKNLCIPQCRA